MGSTPTSDNAENLPKHDNMAFERDKKTTTLKIDYLKKWALASINQFKLHPFLGLFVFKVLLYIVTIQFCTSCVQ